MPVTVTASLNVTVTAITSPALYVPSAVIEETALTARNVTMYAAPALEPPASSRRAPTTAVPPLTATAEPNGSPARASEAVSYVRVVAACSSAGPSRSRRSPARPLLHALRDRTATDHE